MDETIKSDSPTEGVPTVMVGGVVFDLSGGAIEPDDIDDSELYDPIDEEWTGAKLPEEQAEEQATSPEEQAAVEAEVKATPEPTPITKVRDGSKQAALIDLLKRSEGASIKEIAEALKWLNHTVRGAISRDLKKRLGLPVTKSRVEGRGQVYRIES